MSIFDKLNKVLETGDICAVAEAIDEAEQAYKAEQEQLQVSMLNIGIEFHNLKTKLKEKEEIIKQLESELNTQIQYGDMCEQLQAQLQEKDAVIAAMHKELEQDKTDFIMIEKITKYPCKNAIEAIDKALSTTAGKDLLAEIEQYKAEIDKLKEHLERCRGNYAVCNAEKEQLKAELARKTEALQNIFNMGSDIYKTYHQAWEISMRALNKAE